MIFCRLAFMQRSIAGNQRAAQRSGWRAAHALFWDWQQRIKWNRPLSRNSLLLVGRLFRIHELLPERLMTDTKPLEISRSNVLVTGCGAIGRSLSVRRRHSVTDFNVVN
jgi:hypothetical protein